MIPEKPLSWVQRETLTALCKPKNHVARRSCTNSTLCALERRGLVTLKFVRDSYEGVSFGREHWSITPAGRKAVTK